MNITKKFVLTLSLIACAGMLKAQDNPDTSYWSHTGKAALTFSQVGLSNWAAGGDPSVSFNGIVNFSFKYEKESHLWQNVLDAGYGTQKLGTADDFKKTDDNLLFISRYGYRITSKWYLSAITSFRTQFTDGFNYENDTAVLTSTFLAPGYHNIGLGLTYNHAFSEDESFSFTFNPLNLKTTFVMDEELSDQGAYGVEPGKTSRSQGGIDMLLTLRKILVKNVSLESKLALFSPYEDMALIDVNWDLNLWFTINNYLSANISTALIYDHDVAFFDDDGNEYHSAIQFKEVLGLGLTYSF